MIVITGRVRVQSEHLDEALRLSLEHVQRSRKEPGCLSHTVYRDLQDEHCLVFVEEWEDLDAVRTHFAVPESGRFVEAVSALASEPPSMAIHAAKRVTL